MSLHLIFYSHSLHVFHIVMRAVLGSLCELQVLCHCKKKTIEQQILPGASEQATKGEPASARIVLSSVAGDDNRRERFGSLTWATFTSPQVDKVKMDGPN